MWGLSGRVVMLFCEVAAVQMWVVLLNGRLLALCWTEGYSQLQESLVGHSLGGRQDNIDRSG